MENVKHQTVQKVFIAYFEMRVDTWPLKHLYCGNAGTQLLYSERTKPSLGEEPPDSPETKQALWGGGSFRLSVNFQKGRNLVLTKLTIGICFPVGHNVKRCIF